LVLTLSDLPLDTATFAQDAQASGISSLGLNAKAFLFQLTTFMIVFLLLRKFVFSKLTATLEKRRGVLENSLVQAREIEKALQDAEAKAAKLLREARHEADTALTDARAQAQGLVSAAEEVGSQKVQRLLAEAEAQIRQKELKLRQELQVELTDLVAGATEKIIGQKLDKTSDEALIESAIKEVTK